MIPNQQSVGFTVPTHVVGKDIFYEKEEKDGDCREEVRCRLAIHFPHEDGIDTRYCTNSWTKSNMQNQLVGSEW